MNILKKTFFEVLAVVGVFALLAFVLSYFASKEQTESFFVAKLAEQEIVLEIADNEFLRTKGLSERESLGENEGMIFVFDEDTEGLSFWMKNTYIPLDIIFLNSELEVVHIIEDVPICQEDPCPAYEYEGEARFVIEMNAGWSKKNDLELGTYLIHDSSDF